MKPQIFLFDNEISFDKSSKFIKSVVSPRTGFAYSAFTELNEPTLKISVGELKPKAGEKDIVLSIPLGRESFSVDGDKVCIAIGGSEPETVIEPGQQKEIQAIAFGKFNPASGLSLGGSEPLKIELDPSKGHWYVEHDKAAGALNISFSDLV